MSKHSPDDSGRGHTFGGDWTQEKLRVRIADHLLGRGGL
jgi:hypothetical protein